MYREQVHQFSEKERVKYNSTWTFKLIYIRLQSYCEQNESLSETYFYRKQDKKFQNIQSGYTKDH